MCKNDPFEDEIVPPAEKARKELIRRVSLQQVRRYYKKAQCLNKGETKNLGVRLQTISNTEHEYKRAFTANQKIFKINRRRNIGTLVHVQVEDEIKNLDEKRRQSMTLSRLSITQNLEDSIHAVSEENKLPSLAETPLPGTSSSALHDGIPTALTMPKIKRRIKTAPAYRHSSDTALAASQSSEITRLDPLRLLERVENSSTSYSKVRDTLARKETTEGPVGAWRKARAAYPQYLALDSLEEKAIRANTKQQMVNRWKKFHAGSDERCSDMVKKWIQDERYNFVK